MCTCLKCLQHPTRLYVPANRFVPPSPTRDISSTCPLISVRTELVHDVREPAERVFGQTDSELPQALTILSVFNAPRMYLVRFLVVFVPCHAMKSQYRTDSPDVLVGDYAACVRYNINAIRADRHMMKCSPGTADRESFYFGYIAHNVSAPS